MPFDKGHLSRDAYSMRFVGDNTCVLTINCENEQTGAPYARALNDGSVPHDIPNSFGYGMEYGIGGRFDGKFHPGSKKHVGFFDDTDNNNSILGYALNYFARHYKATIKEE